MKKNARARRWNRFLPLLFLLAAVSACTPLRQYRTSLAPCHTAAATHCADAVIEETKDYLLGFVEFDDQGWLWSRPQMHAVLSRLYAEDKEQGLVIVAFVHGWKHNASDNDSNVKMFRTNLTAMGRIERLAARKENRPARKVVGVYAGWRGLSSKGWALENFSFWERKNTAHEVGRSALCELFLRLEDLRNNSRLLHGAERKPTQLIIIGHSFGGAATYSALAPLLIERMVETIDNKGDAHPPRGFGDLVVLINPAFEAARYAVLENIATEMKNGFFTNQPVNLAIFTSKADAATRVAFPLGRKVSTLFDKYSSRFEKKANRTAVGHFTPFITHDLTNTTAVARGKGKKLEPDQPNEDESSERVVALRQQIQNTKSRNAPSRFSFSSAQLIPRDPNHNPFFPLYVVSVDPKIIPDHNGIDHKVFLTFLREFLLSFTQE